MNSVHLTNPHVNIPAGNAGNDSAGAGCVSALPDCVADLNEQRRWPGDKIPASRPLNGTSHFEDISDKLRHSKTFVLEARQPGCNNLFQLMNFEENKTHSWWFFWCCVLHRLLLQCVDGHFLCRPALLIAFVTS